VLDSAGSQYLEVGPTLYTHTAINVDGATDRHWTLLTLRPTAEIVPEADRAPTILGIIALVTIIIGLVGTGLLTRQFTHSIDVFAGATQRFAEGDFTARVDETGQDELGQLAHTFNEMAGAVQQRGAEVRASAARYRLLFDSAPDGVSVLDTEGHLVNCNQETPLLFGRAKEELIGQHIAKVMGPALADEMELFQREFPKLRNLEVTGAEFSHVRADGDTIEIWRKAIPLTDAENNFTGVLVYDRDITERKQAEDRIKTYATRMAQTSHELALSRKKAEDATKLKSEFMATMSHELRTRLNAIIGYCQILLAGIAGELTEKQHDFHERILLNGRNLLNLINDILDLSKIEAGRLDLVKQPFVVQTWLDEAIAQVQSLADAKDLDLQVVLDDRMPKVIVGDADRLNQIALNLLSNAIKFTTEGHVKLHVQKQRDTWQLVVSDTGVGIPPHAQEYIFDEFRQIDGSTRRKHGGTGLGLAIVRNLALMMGGNVRVQSELDKGSMFTVLLPLVVEEPTHVVSEL
ncbi:MAG: PAS domain S-box protein, partial [Anaerolineae bacterium]|nr:PAS domain S-box protein [Anaerolineae bacterium]